MVRYIIIISGPAGVGKTTICDRLVKEFSLHLYRLITATSRQARSNEVDGVDYIFLSSKDFIQKIGEDEFVEHEMIHGNYYGTLKNSLFESSSDKNLLINIDVNGAQSIQNIVSNSEAKGFQTLSIFIRPKSIEDLKDRLSNRGTDEEDEINRRMETAKQEIAQANSFDFIIDSTNKALDYNLVKNFFVKSVGL